MATPAPARRLLCAPLAALLLWLALAASASAQVPNSAHRLTMWVGCEGLAQLTNAELDMWRSRGVGGFVCAGRHLRGLGGSQDFTGDPVARLDTPNYQLQRKLRDSNLVGRLRARGMKAYLGAYLVNYYNTSTPLAQWFADRDWSEKVVPRMRDLAGAARQLGFAGVAFDHEMYAQIGGARTATWKWSYPGNTRPEQTVRAAARERGKQVMSALLSGYPGVELLAYGVALPETWGELVQEQVNGKVDAHESRLDLDFWNGLSSVEGYEALRLMDYTFYKSAHLASWEVAFQYHFNSTYAMLSRRLSNWAYASSRLHVSPFSWIDAGPTTWERARDPAYVAEQLRAFRKWGTGGEFADYSHKGLRSFNYSPYATAMRSAATPGVVDSVPPDLAISSAVAHDGRLTLAGSTRDNLAIRFVRWRNDHGDSGVATMNWHVDSGSPRTGYSWHTRWSAGSIPLYAGANRITVVAEDIKGLTTTTSLSVDASGASGSDATQQRQTFATKPLSRRAQVRCQKRLVRARAAKRRARTRAAKRRARAQLRRANRRFCAPARRR